MDHLFLFVQDFMVYM
nr:unnamed protein product [Callosobruchus chinensis]